MSDNDTSSNSAVGTSWSVDANYRRILNLENAASSVTITDTSVNEVQPQIAYGPHMLGGEEQENEILDIPIPFPELPTIKCKRFTRDEKRAMLLKLELRRIERDKQNTPLNQKVTCDEIVIFKRTGNGRFKFIYHDSTEPLFIKSYNNDKFNNYDGKHEGTFSDMFFFDKNHNYFSPIREYERNIYKEIKTTRNYTRVTNRQIKGYGLKDYKLPSFHSDDSVIIIDRKAFVESHGQIFKIKRKYNISYADILKLKRSIVKRSIKVKKFIDSITEIIKNVYDEDVFDINYEFDFVGSSSDSVFHILIKFPDTIITNEIEQSHKLGTIIVRLNGTYYLHPITYALNLIPDGTRSTFSPQDINVGYVHSHLPSFSYFDAFCMGSNEIMRGIDYTNISPIELEGIMHGLYSYIHWESLEGGPYFKMEQAEGLQKNMKPIPENPFNNDVTRVALKQLFSEYIDDLKPAFNLIIVDGKPKFVADKNHIYDILSDIYKNNPTLLATLGQYTTSRITSYYDPSKKVFYQSTSEIDMLLFFSGSAINNARDRLFNVPIVYINGKYERPQLYDVGIIPEFQKNLITTINPNFIEMLIHVLTNILNQKLKK